MPITLTGLPRTGSFRHAAIASARRFEPEQVLAPGATLHGLSVEAGYIWGTLRDDDGGLYTIMRRIPPARDEHKPDEILSLGGKLILTYSDGSPDSQLMLRREPRYAIDSNSLTRTAGPDSVEFTAGPNEHGRSTRLALTTDSFHYIETDVIEATGTLATPPLQWFLPGPDSSLLYLTQTWFVEGNIAGKPVRGFLFWEEAWMPEGGRLYIDKDPLHDAEYLSWYSWANHYADGSCEVGHYLFGNGDFHVAVRASSDGTVTVGKSMDLTVHRNADGYWHERIDYVIDGERWVCEADPHGRMAGLGKIPNPQQEGRMHRADDDRVPDVWMAWGETVPAAGDRRSW
ncbi:hypothetical protein [Gordonia sp. (in: high G+C Gram-positive bacteria)]|uniref:hypothetical protein n=1 Tax=Gordonia sp. (in: high G+C Gram-positive bacteria) TaxID=84139 RepID=UPI00261F7152|nr:hypothetical protein [Gordonia sp. (in: high G+C Gram-positive bacteria)]HMS74888.1 hypothetical protein [Gordonia sp. (in: high G+C Gram-positive bacteria)]